MPLIHCAYSLFVGQAPAFLVDLTAAIDALCDVSEQGTQRPPATKSGNKLVLLDSVLDVLLDVRPPTSCVVPPALPPPPPSLRAPHVRLTVLLCCRVCSDGTTAVPYR